MQLRQLLVVIDPSQPSQPALQRAHWLARATSAKVELLLCEYNSALSHSLIFDSETLASTPASAPAFAALPGALVALPGQLVAHLQRGAGGRQIAGQDHRHQAALDEAAILRAGGQLLAHVAALGPGDAGQLIEAGHSELDTSAVFKLYESRSI